MIARSLLRWLPTLLLVGGWLFTPSGARLDTQLRETSARDAFRLLDWESTALGTRLNQIWDGLLGNTPLSEDDRQAVRAYFAAPSEGRDTLRSPAERGVERALETGLRALGVGPAAPLPGLFPPVLIAFTTSPNVLIVAPRAELRVLSSTLLKPLDVSQQERLEASADSLGVSSLVVPTGGIATYPAMVLDSGAPAQVVASSAHEWVHHYLVFRPLGAAYWSNQEAREINETVADLVAQEVGARAADLLGLPPLPAPPSAPPPPAASARPPEFDFRAFMRATRLEVERLLAAGRVEAAEAYMQGRQVEVARQGYPIRKLNQAYFAFYGSYGEGFAASPRSPVPALLRQVRTASPSLGAFLRRVEGITTLAELRAL
ncbi:MAG: hypothetical protein HYX52_00765 [Chloroflexi bacterium]|nr:hypothetical protein [Chloroflexota bacterium]